MIYSCGFAEDGQLGLSKEGEKQVSVGKLSLLRSCINVKFVSIAAGGAHSVALSDRGNVYTWGLGSNGRLGLGDKNNRFQPTKVDKLKNVEIITAGLSHVITLDEYGHLYSWGYGKHGSLGHGNELSYFTPHRVDGFDDVKFVDVVAGTTHSLAVTEEGKLYSWGSGEFKLGHGLQKKKLLIPTLIDTPPGNVFVKVASGSNHSVALTASGRLYSWGSGVSGVLGLGNEADVSVPTPVTSTNVAFVSVVAGHAHCVALTEKGSVYVWGEGKHGQLGLGPSLCSVHKPTLVPGLDAITFLSVSAGETHTVALTEDGTVYSWGKGDDGQLGHGSVSEVLWRPTKIWGFDSTIFCAVSAGSYHTLFLTGRPFRQSPYKAYERDLLSLIEKQDFSDISVTLGSHDFKLHSPIIKIKCPKLIENPNHPDLKVRAKSCIKFLSYVYGGRMPSHTVDPYTATELLLLANTFNLTSLGVRCKRLVYKSISLDTYVDIARIGLEKGVDEVFSMCLEYLSYSQYPESYLEKLKKLISLFPHAKSILDDYFNSKRSTPKIVTTPSSPPTTNAIVSSQFSSTSYTSSGNLHSRSLSDDESKYSSSVERASLGSLLDSGDLSDFELKIAPVTPRGSYVQPNSEGGSVLEDRGTGDGDIPYIKQLMNEITSFSHHYHYPRFYSQSTISTPLSPSSHHSMTNTNHNLAQQSFSLKVHKAILASRCSFFDGAFRVRMKEVATGVMYLPDHANLSNGLTERSITSLLRYFYTGQVAHLTDPYECLFILSVSEYYDLTARHIALLVHCGYHVRHSITVENCLLLYLLSRHLGVIKIKERAMYFILSHYTSVAPSLPLLPIRIFMEIQVAFNLKYLEENL